ncbi:MAG: type II toxin-antitoxin system HicA family toxin [Terriglobia bacterium]
MGKLANISGKEAAKAFEKSGWYRVGQVGSHLILVNPAREQAFPFRNIMNFP